MQPEQMTTSNVAVEEPVTIPTAPLMPSANSVYAGYDCGEDCNQHALDHKGDLLDADGWEDEENIDG